MQMHTIKLLAPPTSPYSARVLIQAAEKGIALEVEHPPPGRSVAEHAALNPFRRLPILLVDGTAIIESAAIAEYLEDVYPSPSLRGADALATARVRAAVRAIDLYLFPALGALRGLNPGEPAAAAAFASLREVIDRLLELFDAAGYCIGHHLTLADCALAPASFYIERFTGLHGEPSPREQRPAFGRWWETVTRHASVTHVLEDLERAVKARR